MKDRRITQQQLRTLLLLALLPLASELLPGRMEQAGSAAWLCPLAAGGAAAVLALVCCKDRGAPVDLGRWIGSHWGKLPGRVLLGAFFLWGFVLLTAHASRVGGRLSDALGASPVLLTAAVLLLAGVLASEGVPAFARASEVFALAVGFGFGLVLLFGVFRLQWDYILLWKPEELAQVPGGALTALGTLAVGSYGAFLLSDVREEPKTRRRWMPWVLGTFVLAAAGVLLVLGRFGPALAAEIDRPFFQMVSGLGFEGAFQRLEQLASALWVLGDEALLALLLLALRRLLSQMTGREERRRMGWWILLAVFLGTLVPGVWNVVMDGGVLPLGNLIAGAGMLLLAAQKRKWRFFRKNA